MPLVFEPLKFYCTRGERASYTSLVYGYTKVLAYNLNSTKTSGTRLKMDGELLLLSFLLNLVFQHVRSEADLI